MPSKYLREILVSTDFVPASDQDRARLLRFLGRFEACFRSMYSDMHRKIAFDDPVINSFTLFLTEDPQTSFRIDGSAFLVDVAWRPYIELSKGGDNEFFGHLVCEKVEESIDKASEYIHFPADGFYQALENFAAKNYTLLFGHSIHSVDGAKFKLEALQFLDCVSTSRILRVTYHGKMLLEAEAGRTAAIRTVVSMDQPEASYRDGVLYFKPYDDWWLDQWKGQSFDWSELQQPVEIDIKIDHEDAFRFIIDNKLVQN